MPKKFTCPKCSTTYAVVGFEEEQIKLVNAAVERFAEQVVRILESDPSKSFKANDGSPIVNTCLEKLLAFRQKVLDGETEKG